MPVEEDGKIGVASTGLKRLDNRSIAEPSILLGFANSESIGGASQRLRNFIMTHWRKECGRVEA
jgi:hypothetical protein